MPRHLERRKSILLKNNKNKREDAEKEQEQELKNTKIGEILSPCEKYFREYEKKLKGSLRKEDGEMRGRRKLLW
jgi:hypothetical protein